MTPHCSVITGASRGLGAVLARRLWKEGHSLLLVARGEDALTRMQRDLDARSGQQVHVMATDLALPGAARGIAEYAARVFPSIDVLINNAAVHGPIGRSWETDEALWEHAIRVNLLAPVELCHAFVPVMLTAGAGSIINISGGGATGPRPNFSAYATAKAGLVRFTETLAVELRHSGVQVNAIAPGTMGTDLLKEILDKGEVAAGAREYELARAALQSGGTDMDKVADVCLFLISSRAHGITGKLISAAWDPWADLPVHLDELNSTDIYTLRRIVPKDRGKSWGNDL